MTVSAVRRDDNSKLSYFKTAAIGAVSCYTLKWFLPVTRQEKDERFYTGLKKVNAEVRQARRDKVESIRNSNLPGADEFIQMHDKKQLSRKKIEKLAKPLAEKVIGLYAKVNEIAQETYLKGRSELITSIKRIRPTGIFIFAGIVIGMGVAVINNIFKYTSKQSDIEEQDLD